MSSPCAERYKVGVPFFAVAGNLYARSSRYHGEEWVFETFLEIWKRSMIMDHSKLEGEGFFFVVVAVATSLLLRQRIVFNFKDTLTI